MPNVKFLGLPGAGVSRLAGLYSEQPTILTVIDVRSALPAGELGGVAADFLHQACQVSNGIVFQFMEVTELPAQSFWQNWRNEHAANLPIFRCFHHQMPEGWQDKLGELRQNTLPILALETFRFEVPRISLEHLLMGLDASKQNLGLQLFRVKGVVDTWEYQNLVQIEGTYNRWDTFAADEITSGWIEIQGQNLDPQWLQELIQAAYR